MANFLRGEPQTATERDCKASWCGIKNGVRFRCAFCGHRFVIGDVWRCIYTNDMNRAWGNPLCCAACFTTKEEMRQKWDSLHAEFDSDKFWWFRREKS